MSALLDMWQDGIMYEGQQSKKRLNPTNLGAIQM